MKDAKNFIGPVDITREDVDLNGCLKVNVKLPHHCLQNFAFGVEIRFELY